MSKSEPDPIQQLEETTLKIAGLRHRFEEELAPLEAERDRIRAALRQAISGSNGNMTVAEGTKQETPSSLKRAPMSLLKTAEVVQKASGPADARWLATQMGIDEVAAGIRLSRATKAGLLRRVSKGKYEAVKEGEGP